jgi:glycosyltransferase involved in cell wall biosynthesis
MPERLRVCLVALNAYAAIDAQAQGPIGGIETRAWMFARGLAAQGDIDVSFVVRHDRAPRLTVAEGVRLIPLVDRLYRWREAVRMCVGKRATFPWLTLHQWRSSLLWQFPVVAAERLLRGRPGDPWHPDPRLTEVPADVFCTFGVQSHSATVITSAHAAHRPALLVLGSDGDLDEHYGPESTFVSPYGDRGDVCWRILQEADVIVAQTPEQQRVLMERFGRESIVIANPIDVAEWDARRTQPMNREDTAGLERYVLWIGRADAVHKRPQLCVELARMCPEVEFLLIMNPRDPALEQRLRRERPPNVRFVSWVPFPRMPAIFAHAAALVNTSLLEGFANTFLQAALSEVPIASLEVGAPFLAELGCGCIADGDLGRLADYLRNIWRHGEDRTTLAQAREFVVQRHGLAQKTFELADVIRRSATRQAH